MVIYGVMILGACMLLGTALGLAIGKLIGIPGDIGGVGFAMLFLVFATEYLKKKGMMPKLTEQGVLFWNAMYIPVVIAMAATQNVVAALHGGVVAFLAGIISVVALFPLIRILSAMAGAATSRFEEDEEDNKAISPVPPSQVQPKQA